MAARSDPGSMKSPPAATASCRRVRVRVRTRPRSGPDPPPAATMEPSPLISSTMASSSGRSGAGPLDGPIAATPWFPPPPPRRAAVGKSALACSKFLDRCMPKQSFVNLSTKVILNQIVLGPCVIAVVFAWNNLWLGKLSELPSKYQNDALPTLLYGFKFWIPVLIVNFGYGHLASHF
ncbi:hypothetical protein PVAP13_3NG322500 [Panicum virgatum]|uniref:Uncharacterized protein n=1 Tax=Panicum virgatum TaxID=38727 RepID=A0A8T0UAL7_PANVG|nr:hypothetical protein PVAP13_3NG322500 [Panicum virgatum]